MIDIGSDEIERYRSEGYLPPASVLGDDERGALLAAERRFRVASPFGTSAGLVVTEQLEHMSSAVLRGSAAKGATSMRSRSSSGPTSPSPTTSSLSSWRGRRAGRATSRCTRTTATGDSNPRTTSPSGSPSPTPPPRTAASWSPRSRTSAASSSTRWQRRNPALRQAASVDTVPLELAAGEAVAFSGMMLHGSGENRTDRRARRPVRPLLRPSAPAVDDDRRRQGGARRRPLVDGPRRGLDPHLAPRPTAPPPIWFSSDSNAQHHARRTLGADAAWRRFGSGESPADCRAERALAR